jgi:hypothetical protein
MYTEHLHRTLSPEVYARLLDDIRHQAESERRLAVQTVFLAWPSQLLQRARRALHPISHTHALNA